MPQLWDIYTLFTGIILLLCAIDGETKTIRCCEEHVFVFSQTSLDTHLSLTGLDPMMVKMQMRGCGAEKPFDPVFTLQGFMKENIRVKLKWVQISWSVLRHLSWKQF